MSEPTVVVCGTINIDTFVSVQKFPQPGDTTIGKQGLQSLGGKGANQAVACARMGTHPEGHTGIRTILLSAVGHDPQGDAALKALTDHGVNVEYVTATSLPTGQAFIMNDATGENIIIVVSGANEIINPASFRPLVEKLREQGPVPVILAQGELTPAHSAELPRLAEHPDTRLVLNLGPVTTRDAKLLQAADPLIVNEGEARDVLDLPRDTPLEEVLNQLTKITKSLVVTLGSQGAIVVEEGAGASGAKTIPAIPVNNIVDTTGAGDAFVGTLAAALAGGATLLEAARLGNAAGALAIQKQGAAASYATAEEIRALVSGS